MSKASGPINMDLITDDEYHVKMQKGYDDIVAGKVQNAVIDLS